MRNLRKLKVELTSQPAPEILKFQRSDHNNKGRADAVRQRRRRARRNKGRGVYYVEANEHETAEALIASGRVRDDQSANRKVIERALAQLLADFNARWCGHA